MEIRNTGYKKSIKEESILFHRADFATRIYFILQMFDKAVKLYLRFEYFVRIEYVAARANQ